MKAHTVVISAGAVLSAMSGLAIWIAPSTARHQGTGVRVIKLDPPKPPLDYVTCVAEPGVRVCRVVVRDVDMGEGNNTAVFYGRTGEIRAFVEARP